MKVTVLGAGLAGSEAALTLAAGGARVELIDIKPDRFTPAHSNGNFCELVCSNSLKSNDITSSGGLLKEELRRLGSRVLAAAELARVDAGGSLSVDRELFARTVTDKINNEPNITAVCREAVDLNFDNPLIVATGPLTTDALARSLAGFLGSESLSFYDAAAPIVEFDSIEMSHAFFGSRYNKGGADYINCPLNREEYGIFYDALIGAEKAKLKAFEDVSVFEGCMPIEILAARGVDAIRFGAMKPVGLYDGDGKRHYAVLQLRAENVSKTAYNLVGFQTNLTFPEQRRVFGLIPALKNAVYSRYGVMHRNTYVNAPKALGYGFRAFGSKPVYIAGQLSGVEGYCESIMSGLVAARNVLRGQEGLPPLRLSPTTVTGALLEYLTRPNANFQPMNANFGILPPLESAVKQKKERYAEYAARALRDISGDILQ